MNWFIQVAPEQIRHIGSRVYMTGQQMADDVTVLSRRVNEPTGLGTDRIGAVMRDFHARTTGVSLTYFAEVAQATQDMGIALGETADAYDEMEQGNIAAITRVAQTIRDLGVC